MEVMRVCASKQAYATNATNATNASKGSGGGSGVCSARMHIRLGAKGRIHCRLRDVQCGYAWPACCGFLESEDGATALFRHRSRIRRLVHFGSAAVEAASQLVFGWFGFGKTRRTSMSDPLSPPLIPMYMYIYIGGKSK
jgi:hypothetical protein